MEAEELGRVVHYHRTKAGLSRVQCARLAGIGKTSLFDLERGKPTVKLATVLAVCRALNIDLEPQSPLMDHYRATRTR